jgi:hypothetical protein
MPFKKIFKPIAKVLDKVIPNEIKPALPFAAAFLPVFGPASVQGFIGNTMARRALTSGLLNIGAQLSQEGNEGDINLLSAGLGALSGAMTAPNAASTFRGVDPEFIGPRTAPEGILGKGKELLARGSEFMKVDPNIGGTTVDLLSKEGLKIAAAPAAQATGDVMQAQARQLEKQAAIDAALAEAEALADSGLRGDAIRNAMRAYGFFTDDEIESTVSSAGYKAGGRVGFKFGGIDEAIEMVEKETVEKGKEGIMQASGEDPMLIEEYNKYVFDLLEQRPNAKPMSFADFKRMVKAGMKDGGRVGLQEGGVLTQILPQFQPFLGRPAFAPTLQQAEAVFPRLNELERGVNIAEQDLGRIRERLGDQPRQLLSANMALQGPVGLQPTNMLSIAQLANRGDVPQGMKEGGLMDLGGKEMDLRKGGFVPIGKKEKADDVPARLSKNEFVMTADAVRAAGGGSVNKGAKRMYNLMNTLEARA